MSDTATTERPALPTRYFIELTQPEIAAQLASNPLVILPAGSVEQHAAHLPTGTDIYAAEAVSHAVAERMDGLVLPAGPLGVTPMHMPFEGTISLRPETYMALVMDIGISLAQHGARRLLIVNWHEGNSAPLALAAESLHRDHGLSVVTVHACYVAADLYGPSCGGLTHGGEIEALAVLARRPDLVHLDRVRPAGDDRQGVRMDRLRRSRNYQPVLRDVQSIMPSGWYGAPQHATPEKAARMVVDIADAIATEASEIFAQLDLVQGGARVPTLKRSA